MNPVDYLFSYYVGTISWRYCLGDQYHFIGIPNSEIWISVSILRRARQLVWIAFGIIAYFLIYDQPASANMNDIPPILKDEIISNEVFVWPFEKGSERGQSITPIYPKAVDAAREDEVLYDVLALLGSIRIGKVREKELAIQKLKMIFDQENV